MRKLKWMLAVLAILISGASVLLVFYGNSRIAMDRERNDKLSFYYRDTADVDSLFPDLSAYDVAVCDSVACLSGRRMFFPEPETIGLPQLHLQLNFSKDGDTLSRTLHTRCWKDGFCVLQEDTKAPLLAASKARYYYETVLRKVFHLGYDYVAALGDTTFVFKHGRVSMITPEGRTRCGRLVIEDPVYVQLIRGGEAIYIRNKNKLQETTDLFRTTRTIYDERRGLRESMFWDEVSNRLVFSMYTPGSVRMRHYLLAYDPAVGTIDTLQVFHTTSEHKENGAEPFCRHIHLLSKDPYTGDMYVGVGDYNGESGIFRSRDGGRTLNKIGQGSQLWRTLAFYYTQEHIFWTSDSESAQYICRISRKDMETLPLDTFAVTRFPLFNSAIWCNLQTEDGLYVVGSNSEGHFYDDFHRIYGLEFEAGIPTAYNLIEEKSLPNGPSGIIYHQLFPTAFTSDGTCYAFDLSSGYRKFHLVHLLN